MDSLQVQVYFTRKFIGWFDIGILLIVFSQS